MEKNAIIEVIKANKSVIIKRVLIVAATALGMVLVRGLLRNDENDLDGADEETEVIDSDSTPVDTNE